MKITQSLKQTILNLEAALGHVERHNFNKSQYRSWSDCNWDFQSTKGVKHDAVYLYEIPVIGVKANFGLSFDFLTSCGFNSSKPMPFEDQKVRFSYCLNVEGIEPNDVIYSEYYNAEQARIILKAMRKDFINSFEPFESSLDDFILIFEKHVFKMNIGEIPTRLESAHKAVNPKKEKLRKLITEQNEANSKYQSVLTCINIDVKASAEYKKVQKLRDELQKAEKKLEKRKKEINKNNNLDEASSKILSAQSKRVKFQRQFLTFVTDTMNKFGLPTRFKDELEKI